MGCPYWKEIAMVFCDATPVRKLVPADRVVPAGPCSCGGYERCPIFLEAMARMRQCAQEGSARRPLPTEKEGS